MIDIPFDVLATERGTRLDVFLTRRIKRMSRTLAATLIRSGMVRRQGGTAITKPATRVLEGDRILLKRKKLNEAPTDSIVVPVIYEDERMIAVSKPGDLVVHPTASAYHRTLIRILRTRMDERFLDLAHRIDKETSGLVLLARDREAGTNLKQQFASRAVKKAYLAVVARVPNEDRMTLALPMRLKPASLSGVLMEIGGEEAQPAVTEIVVLSRGRDAALVEARPHTGRQHQIRLHLAHAGHPIIGDKLYLGGEQVFLRALRGEISDEELLMLVGHPRQALHAWHATFAHPATGERMTLRAPPPPDFIELCARFQLGLTG
jgi:23S rRNA pseudouridine1911/1915/1917 synthase